MVSLAPVSTSTITFIVTDPIDFAKKFADI